MNSDKFYLNSDKMTQRTYLEEIPRDIINFMKPYVEGDLPTYRAIAEEIYDRIISNQDTGFINIELLNRPAVINFIVSKLLNYFGPDIVPAKIVDSINGRQNKKSMCIILPIFIR